MLGERLKAQPGEIAQRVTAMAEDLRQAQKDLAAVRSELAVARARGLVSQAEPCGGFQLLVVRLDGVEAASLQRVGQELQERLGEGAAVVLGGLPEPADAGKVILVAAFGKAVIGAGPQAGTIHRRHRQSSAAAAAAAGRTWPRPAAGMGRPWMGRWRTPAAN